MTENERAQPDPSDTDGQTEPLGAAPAPQPPEDAPAAQGGSRWATLRDPARRPLIGVAVAAAAAGLLVGFLGGVATDSHPMMSLTVGTAPSPPHGAGPGVGPPMPGQHRGPGLVPPLGPDAPPPPPPPGGPAGPGGPGAPGGPGGPGAPGAPGAPGGPGGPGAPGGPRGDAPPPPPPGERGDSPTPDGQAPPEPPPLPAERPAVRAG